MEMNFSVIEITLSIYEIVDQFFVLLDDHLDRVSLSMVSKFIRSVYHDNEKRVLRNRHLQGDFLIIGETLCWMSGKSKCFRCDICDKPVYRLPHFVSPGLIAVGNHIELKMNYGSYLMVCKWCRECDMRHDCVHCTKQFSCGFNWDVLKPNGEIWDYNTWTKDAILISRNLGLHKYSHRPCGSSSNSTSATWTCNYDLSRPNKARAMYSSLLLPLQLTARLDSIVAPINAGVHCHHSANFIWSCSFVVRRIGKEIGVDIDTFGYEEKDYFDQISDDMFIKKFSCREILSMLGSEVPLLRLICKYLFLLSRGYFTCDDCTRSVVLYTDFEVVPEALFRKIEIVGKRVDELIEEFNVPKSKANKQGKELLRSLIFRPKTAIMQFTNDWVANTTSRLTKKRYVELNNWAISTFQSGREWIGDGHYESGDFRQPRLPIYCNGICICSEYRNRPQNGGEDSDSDMD